MKTKGQDFGSTRRIEHEYERGIKGHLIKILPPKLPEQTFDEWINSIAQRSNEYDAREAAESLAGRMVRWVNTKNVKGWRAAAAKAQRSRMLSGLLQREMQTPIGARVRTIVRENAQYISSLPRDAAEQLNREVLRAQQNGARPATIAKMMRTRFPQLLHSRINQLARTESQKASTALTRARCEELNLPCYIWETSEDGDRVRLSHRKMQGVVVFWDDPPAPELLVGERSQGHYHAGDIYNCRCTQTVVLTLEDIRFPARVYRHGSITRMTRVQFRALATNLESRN